MPSINASPASSTNKLRIRCCGKLRSLRGFSHVFIAKRTYRYVTREVLALHLTPTHAHGVSSLLFQEGRTSSGFSKFALNLNKIWPARINQTTEPTRHSTYTQSIAKEWHQKSKITISLAGRGRWNESHELKPVTEILRRKSPVITIVGQRMGVPDEQNHHQGVQVGSESELHDHHSHSLLQSKQYRPANVSLSRQNSNTTSPMVLWQSHECNC